MANFRAMSLSPGTFHIAVFSGQSLVIFSQYSSPCLRGMPPNNASSFLLGANGFFRSPHQYF